MILMSESLSATLVERKHLFSTDEGFEGASPEETGCTPASQPAKWTAACGRPCHGLVADSGWEGGSAQLPAEVGGLEQASAFDIRKSHPVAKGHRSGNEELRTRRAQRAVNAPVDVGHDPAAGQPAESADRGVRPTVDP